MTRASSLKAGPGGRARTLQEIAEHVEGQTVPHGDGCLLWTGHKNRKGYGNTTWDGRYWQVHRLVYTARVGEIPDGMVIDHTCHNRDQSCPGGDTCVHRACVAYGHLQAVTGLVNKQRSPLTHKARCKHGHAMTPENTYIRVTGRHERRSCRICKRKQAVESVERQRAVRAGEIGPVRRRVDLEPMPESEPVREPAAPEPARVPEPAR